LLLFPPLSEFPGSEEKNIFLQSKKGVMLSLQADTTTQVTAFWRSE
jgi:hypothetical protein